LVSRISFIQPIKIVYSSGEVKIIPKQLLQNNVSLLHNFLDLEIEDWNRVSSPVQKDIDETSEKGALIFTGIEAFIKLEPYFLKCLFSYAFFFVSLENCYKNLYNELIELGKNPKYRVEHSKRPRRSPDLENLFRVRNWSIAHIGEANTKNKEDKIALMSWTPVLVSKINSNSWDYNKILFETLNVRINPADGGLINTNSKLELPDILTLHKEAEEYYSKYEDNILNILERLRVIISTEL
jgi:hypothetical protein